MYLVGQHYSNHAQTSGYDQIARALRRPLQWRLPPERSPASDSMEYLNQWYRLEQSLQELYIADAARRGVVRVVHFIYGDSDYRVASRLAAPSTTKWVATFHQPAGILGRIGIDERVIRSLDAAVVVGSSQVEYFRERGARAVHVIPHGVDCSVFRPSAGFKEFSVLTIGSHLRDFELYFQTVLLAHRQRLPLEFRLVIAPAPPKALTPPNCTILSGIADTALLREYRHAACCFQPLSDMTASNTLLEAMACGVPCVISDVGSVRDYIDEPGGILVSGTDPERWVGALMDAAQGGPLHECRSKVARAMARRFDWAAVAKRLDRLYGEIQQNPQDAAQLAVTAQPGNSYDRIKEE